MSLQVSWVRLPATPGNCRLFHFPLFSPHNIYFQREAGYSEQVQLSPKASRILGMIYHKFYRFYGTSTLLRLLTLLKLMYKLLNYCSFMWDPPLVKDQEAMELVQKFALRLCCKTWSAAYLQLLHSTGLTALSAERKL